MPSLRERHARMKKQEQERRQELEAALVEAASSLGSNQLTDLIELVEHAGEKHSVTHAAIQYVEKTMDQVHGYFVVSNSLEMDAVYRKGKLDKRTKEGKREAAKLDKIAEAVYTLRQYKLERRKEQ